MADFFQLSTNRDVMTSLVAARLTLLLLLVTLDATGDTFASIVSITSTVNLPSIVLASDHLSILKAINSVSEFISLTCFKGKKYANFAGFGEKSLILLD